MVLVGGAAGVYWGCEVKGSGDFDIAARAEAVAERIRGLLPGCFDPMEQDYRDHVIGEIRHVATAAIEDARRAESEAIADFVALRGSESGYTHVEDLVAAIRSRGAADPTVGRGTPMKVHYAQEAFPEDPYCGRTWIKRDLRLTRDRYRVTCIPCVREMGWRSRITELRSTATSGEERER